MKQDERRRAPRVKVDQMVEISLGGKENFMVAHGTNISQTGLHCLCRESVEMYQRIDLIFSLPNKGSEFQYRAEAVVMRCQKAKDAYSVGLQFVSVNPELPEIL